MPRYLFHSSEAAYDAATRTYTFTIEKRVPHATTLTIDRFGFTASTAASYPQAVYVRSDALTDLCKVKSLMEVRSANHESQSDVVVVLEEAHGPGRYQLDRSAHRFPIVRFHNRLAIDFRFSDGPAVLHGAYTVPSQPAVTDAEVLALPDMLMMLDWDHTANILPALITAGTDVTSINSRVFSNLGYSLIFSTSAAGLEYSTFGATHALESTVSWHYAIENSSGNNPGEGQVGTLSMMFRTKDVLTGWHWIFNSPLFQITAGSHMVGATFMGYYDADTSNYEVTSLQIAAASDYFLQVRKVGTTFEWLLRDLSNGVEQTETTASNTRTNGQPNQTWGISSAQTGISGMKISHIIEISSLDVDDLLTIKNWMLQKYTGQNIPGVPDPNGRDAAFYAEMTIDSR